MHPSDTINSNSPNTHLPPNTYRHQPSPTINTQSPPTTTSHHHNFFPPARFPLLVHCWQGGHRPTVTTTSDTPRACTSPPSYSSRPGVFTYIYYSCTASLPGFFPYPVPGPKRLPKRLPRWIQESCFLLERYHE